MSPPSCYLRSSDTQFGTPDPRSAGFDTDIGAFIESSIVLPIEGSMVIEDKGDTMFTQVRALLMEVIPYFLLD